MAETDMRHDVVKELNSYGWDAFSVENKCGLGTPDVNYLHGWLELKWLRAYPKRESTIVTFDHWSQDQANFLMRRHAAGGNAHLLIKCRREWLLYEAQPAADYINATTREQLWRFASRKSNQGLQKGMLKEWLSN